jgi:hypothetical protein
MAIDNDRVKKILRLLESDQMGERATAAAMLTRMAQAEKLNLDELMAKVYGGSASSSQQGSPWGSWGGGQREREEAARRQNRREQEHREQARQQQNERDRQQREAEQRAWAERMRQRAKAEEEARSHRTEAPGGGWDAEGDPDAMALLKKLRGMYAEHGDRMLTEWEREFTRDILARKMGFYGLSGKQEAVIQRILNKYASYASANF